MYADTSVYGGVGDAEFSAPSKQFLKEVARGRFELAVSAIVQREISDAPREVCEVFDSVLAYAVVFDIPDGALELRQAYLEAGVVGPRSRADALHVACASVLKCAMIVSWNFKHIVHFDKIEQYNTINAKRGLGRIAIHSPNEVIDYENPEESI